MPRLPPGLRGSGRTFTQAKATMTENTEETKRLATSAFWAILATGVPPTVDLINDWFLQQGHRKRNRNRISEQLKTCWAELGTRTQVGRTIPGIPQETVELVVALRDHMLALAKREFEESTRDEHARAQSLVDEANANLAKLEAQLESVRAEAGRLEREREQLVSELSTCGEKLLAEQEVRIRSAAELEVERRHVAELDADRKHLTARIAQQDADHRAALDAEAERYKALQRSLMQQLDDEKVRAANLAKKLEGSSERIQSLLNDATVRERQFTDQRAALSAELGQVQGRANALHDHLTELQTALEKMRGEAAAAATRAAGAAARIQELEALLAERAPVSLGHLTRLLQESYLQGAKAATTTGKASRAPLETKAERHASTIIDELVKRR